jgi:methylmalonyl-CoA/ethylmalonyl-CoA epimerase
MDISRITEVGVAVPDLDAATKLFAELLGATVGEEQIVERYSMKFRMCRLGKVDFELMAPLGDTGVIADFLHKRGPGLHHVAFAVDDVERGMRDLEHKGVRFVDGEPIEGYLSFEDFAGRQFTDNIKFTFSHPASLLGILFEFIEYPEGYQTP